MGNHIKKSAIILTILFFTYNLFCDANNYTSKIKQLKDEKNLEVYFYLEELVIAHQIQDKNENIIMTEGKIPDDVIFKTFYFNGNLYKESIYKNDKPEGINKKYFENGMLSSENNFKNNKRDGIQTEYYENGKLQSEAKYVNGELEGNVKYYDENGLLQDKNL